MVFQELENGVPGKPPNGVFDLISHLFEPDLSSSKTPVTLPVGVRVFDLLPAALGENEDEQNPATVQFDDQEPEGDPVGEPEMEDNPIDEPDVENDSVGEPEAEGEPVNEPVVGVNPVGEPEPEENLVREPEQEDNPAGPPVTALRQEQIILAGPRNRRAPVRWIDESTTPYYAGMASVGDFEPNTLKKALTSPRATNGKKRWRTRCSHLKRTKPGL